MAVIRLQEDWRLLACYYCQKVTNQQYMIRRDDFYIQVFESVYTKKQEKNNKPKLVINQQHRALVSSQQHFYDF